MTIFVSIAAACLFLVAGEESQRRTWTVAGIDREAMVFVPAKKSSEPPPLVFGFHGHGGAMQQAARSFALHEGWPEAVVVYMQGLPTPGALTDPEGKRAGWQRSVGDQGDRDLKFFDLVLQDMKKDHHADERRIYATGHSNGGAFTYLVWSARPGLFAAVAPSAAAGAARLRDKLTPCPCLHLAGERDPLVRFEWQTASMAVVREINGCSNESERWADGCLLYPSDKSAPFVSFIHPGGHRYPAEAPALIVKFFQQHRRPALGAARTGE